MGSFAGVVSDFRGAGNTSGAENKNDAATGLPGAWKSILAFFNKTNKPSFIAK